MKQASRIALIIFSFISLGIQAADIDSDGHHHHHHHRQGHHHRHRGRNQGEEQQLASSSSSSSLSAAKVNSSISTVVQKEDAEAQIQDKLQKVTEGVEALNQSQPVADPVLTGRLRVNGPLPPDFIQRFQQATAQATGCDPNQVAVSEDIVGQEGKIIVFDFSAPKSVVESVEDQAGDPTSKLANGPLRPFLIADDTAAFSAQAPATDAAALAAQAPAAVAPTIDIDTEMPYGELEPFGREDTGQELSEHSIKESDEMVDQLERAEVAEEKRAVFRALTRLRGAAITSFDGIARSQTGNIDEYNKVHQWRQTHPLNHLANEEANVAQWAFPDVADF
jgi:hypothetical protein